jgi:predicted nuclease of predicted toxin-antitoxin system
VKLLLDHNLSYRLVPALHTLYPGSVHARDVGLQMATDEAVWSYARAHDLVIVSKDVDFHQRSLVFGAPPRLVWIRRGNCSTDEILALLRTHHPELLAFEADQEATFLALG